MTPLTSIPGHDDSLYAEYFEGTQRCEIRLPFCPSCTRFHWYPLVRCPHCGSASWEWKTVRPIGTLFTWTVLRRALDPAIEPLVGQTVALVVPDDAPDVRLVVNLVEVDEPRIGMRLVARFVSAGEVVVPVFTSNEEEEVKGS